MGDTKQFLDQLKNQETRLEKKKIDYAKAEQDLENNQKLLNEQLDELKKLNIEHEQLEVEIKKLEQEINQLLQENEEKLK